MTFVLRDESGVTGGREGKARVAVHKDDDVFTKRCERDIVVMVPGNPGVSAFYTEFLEHLMTQVPGKRMVCLGFAGHTPGRSDGVFSVEEQIHFVRSLVDRIRETNETARLHFMGHSVGAYVGVNVAAQLPEEHVASFTGLFPTVEHIAQGSNAVVRPVFVPGLRHMAAGLAGALGYLPAVLRNRVAKMFATTTDPDHIDTVAGLADFSLINNLLYMAGTEMVDITDMPHSTLEKLAHKSNFYYAEVDGWVPDHLIPRMEQHLETLTGKQVGKTPTCAGPRVVRDTTKAPHAFVLSHSKEVAEAIAPMLHA
eukprot:TRINITY_DN27983_c0_g2_i4.p1 TRINITY_DN27983_c0_g2~~TRINITY_DN27983_c0_g2_i4.p1  ORF type:complete len:331 (+),score=129.81 TRINITY_DN27983_c0_g2_i4:63-995(+)